MKTEGRNTPVVDETFAKFLNAITRASSVPEEPDPLTPIGIAYLCFWQSVNATLPCLKLAWEWNTLVGLTIVSLLLGSESCQFIRAEKRFGDHSSIPSAAGYQMYLLLLYYYWANDTYEFICNSIITISISDRYGLDDKREKNLVS